MAVTQNQNLKPAASKLERFRFWFLVVIGVAYGLLYAFRPLLTEGITVWPSWLWASGALFFTIIIKRKARSRILVVPTLIWLIVGVVYSEIWRIVLPINTDSEHALRVVTFNCATYVEESLTEIASLNADIILLQESATIANEKSSIAKILGTEYDFYIGIDASIFVKGKIKSLDSSESNRSIAVVELENGRQIRVVSLRMQPPTARLDFWKNEYWQSFSDHRSQHHDELRTICNDLPIVSTDTSTILGGDFNLVHDAQQAEILGSQMSDSFISAGKGWYGTALNELPLFRIDKIWSSSDLKPITAWSRTSKVSDHRYVVADYNWR